MNKHQIFVTSNKTYFCLQCGQSWEAGTSFEEITSSFCQGKKKEEKPAKGPTELFYTWVLDEEGE